MKEHKIEGAEINTALRLARQLYTYLDMVLEDISVTNDNRGLWEDAISEASNCMYKLCEVAGCRLYEQLCERTEEEEDC